MDNFNFLSEYQWHPFRQLGYTHAFFNIDITTVINSWYLLLFILIFGLFSRYVIYRGKGLIFHALIIFIKSFQEMIVQTLGFFSFQHFSFVTSLFIYILFCNSLGLIPGLEEPTKNLNTTLALACISFFYVQYYAIATHGLVSYVLEYFEPIFLMLPLNIIGKFASVISMGFRLYGNIFGGTTITSIYYNILHASPLYQTIGLVTGINLTITLFFGLFEGIIQAFVFAMLTVTYLSIALAGESH